MRTRSNYKKTHDEIKTITDLKNLAALTNNDDPMNIACDDEAYEQVSQYRALLDKATDLASKKMQ